MTNTTALKFYSCGNDVDRISTVYRSPMSLADQC